MLRGRLFRGLAHFIDQLPAPPTLRRATHWMLEELGVEDVNKEVGFLTRCSVGTLLENTGVVSKSRAPSAPVSSVRPVLRVPFCSRMFDDVKHGVDDERDKIGDHLSTNVTEVTSWRCPLRQRYLPP